MSGAWCAANDVPDPLFVLAVPRSFSSVACAMLGQHPQMHGLPETHLFRFETLQMWWDDCAPDSHGMAHGLLRAVAQLCFGEQTEHTIKLATGWLRRRLAFTSGMAFEELARAAPVVLVDSEVDRAILVEKSPSTVYEIESLRRVQRFFPQARFLHLARHPKGVSESAIRYRDMHLRNGITPPRWLIELADAPGEVWHRLNTNILMFLKTIPTQQWMRVRGEDLLTRPQTVLRQIASWLELPSRPADIRAMMHPEHSPYAHRGPPGAEFGNDVFFLDSTALRPARATAHTLDRLPPHVVDVARYLGYR